MMINISLLLLLGVTVLVVLFVASTAAAAAPLPLHRVESDDDDGLPLMSRVYVKNARARNAVANDGSDAAFYISNGDAALADKHLAIIWLQGGWCCSTKQSCIQRCGLTGDNGYCSGKAKYHPATKKATTLYLSTDPLVNPFGSAGVLVGVPYQSSDVWAGSAGNQSDAFGIPFEFRGREIVKSVFEDLFDGTNSSSTFAKILPGSKIVFVGESAGGVGVLTSINFVASLVRTHCPTCSVHAVPDSGFFVGDITALEQKLERRSICQKELEFCAIPWEYQLGAPLWNYAATVDPACNATMRALGRPTYHCLFGQVAALTVAKQNKFMMLQYLFDAVEMTADLNELVLDPLNVTALELLTEIVTIKRAAFNHVPASFLPTCTGHEMDRGLKGPGLTAGYTTLYDALSAWFKLGVEKRYADKCTSMKCRHCPHN